MEGLRAIVICFASLVAFVTCCKELEKRVDMRLPFGILIGLYHGFAAALVFATFLDPQSWIGADKMNVETTVFTVFVSLIVSALPIAILSLLGCGLCMILWTIHQARTRLSQLVSF